MNIEDDKLAESAPSIRVSFKSHNDAGNRLEGRPWLTRIWFPYRSCRAYHCNRQRPPNLTSAYSIRNAIGTWLPIALLIFITYVSRIVLLVVGRIPTSSR